MQKTDNDANLAGDNWAWGVLVLGLIAVDGCSCRPRQAVPLAPRANEAPRWEGALASQAELSVPISICDLPLSDARPVYGMPLVVKIENVPEIPARINGPMKKMDPGPGKNSGGAMEKASAGVREKGSGGG